MKSKKRILVIDDEEKLCRIIQRRLELSGEYEVVVTFSGVEGLEAASKQSFDLVITDVKMPGMEGSEVIKTLKAKQPKLPVVLFSVYHDDITIVTPELRNLVDGLLAKPIDHDKLQTTIAAALASSAASEED